MLVERNVLSHHHNNYRTS